MMRDRRYGGESRHRSPTPPPRRLSPPPGRFRDRVEYRGYSLPRRRYNMDMEEERRGGELSRRDYDRYHEKHYDRGGGREYERNFSRGEKLNDRDYDRNFSRGDKDNVRGFSRGGGNGGTRVVSYNADHKDDGRSFSRGSEGMRLPNYNGDDRGGDRSFTRGGGGMRIPNYNGGDRDRDRGYGDREKDRDDGHTRSVYQSSGSGEYSRNVYGSRTGTSSKFQAGTQSKFQWDHRLDETRKSDCFKSSIDRGVGGSGVRSDLEYDYQETKFFDKGRDGLVLDSKPMLIEAERGRDYSSSSYLANVSLPTNSSSHVDVIGTGISMSTRYTTSGLHKDEDYHFQDKLHSEKLVADGPVMRDPLIRESYKDKLLQYSSLDTDYMVSSSQLKAFDPVPLGSFKEDIPSSLREDLSLPSDGVRASIGLTTNSIGYNRSGEKSRTRSPLDHEGRFGNFKSYSRSYLSTAEEKHRDYAYPVVGSGEQGGTFPRSADLYGKAPSVGEDYRHRDMSRLGISDSTGDRGDESSHHGYLRGSRLLGHHATSLGQSTSDYYNANDSFHAKRKDLEGQGYGSPQPKHERESYHGLGSSRLGEHNDDHEVAGGSRFHHRLSDVLPSREYDLQLGDIDGRSQEKLTLGNVSFSKPFKNRLKRKHAEKKFGGHSNPSHDLEDEGEPWSDNVDSSILSKRLKVGKSKYGKSRRALNMMARHQSPSGTVSFSPSSHSRRSNISGTRDIKKRLGPIAPKLHVSQRLVKKYKPSLKKRLGPGRQRHHVTLPWLKNLNAPNLPRIQDGSGGSGHVQAEDLHEDNVADAKPEPPENSEDFKQLVKIAFFKFVKQLNDTPAKRRKYKELGIAGSLKCIVCRRFVYYIMKCYYRWRNSNLYLSFNFFLLLCCDEVCRY